MLRFFASSSICCCLENEFRHVRQNGCYFDPDIAYKDFISELHHKGKTLAKSQRICLTIVDGMSIICNWLLIYFEEVPL